MTTPLFTRFEGYDRLKPLLEGSDEDVLVALNGKPALIRIPGTDEAPRARFVACLLHGNEDSGYRAVLEVLRRGAHHPFDLWVLIGNVRAASQEGWYAHRFLDDQEDFNRVWDLSPSTTRMRRCADEVLEILRAEPLEAAVDLHNNTGENPFYAVIPRWDPPTLALAARCANTALSWSLRAHTLMEALSSHCPAVAVECGVPGVPAHQRYATGVIDRLLAATDFSSGKPDRLFEMRGRVVVRPEVPFAFGGQLSDDIELVLHPGLDGANFGMLLAGTELGVVHPDGVMPLLVTDVQGRDVTDHYFAIRRGGSLIVTEDVTPVMMTTTVQQTRRDCLFYLARRRT
jgi:hypothetical protein